MSIFTCGSDKHVLRCQKTPNNVPGISIWLCLNFLDDSFIATIQSNFVASQLILRSLVNSTSEPVTVELIEKQQNLIESLQ